ncbi:hypothetical protein Hamer_G019403 [Homarus americanus]|uniref:Uncharacterized protein n=1 Tax=Homarus americanus TaxID=6706 RepID=A0A8J5MSM1_HOMAM|nr:hypothetical protein Hamer_G019403 [Homarus americanus]
MYLRCGEEAATVCVVRF